MIKKKVAKPTAPRTVDVKVDKNIPNAIIPKPKRINVTRIMEAFDFVKNANEKIYPPDSKTTETSITDIDIIKNVEIQ